MKHFFFCVSFLLIASNLVAQTQYKVGQRISDFSYTDIEGNTKSLSSYKQARGVILIFTCNTCPYAIAYEDRIKALHEKSIKQGFPVLAINPNDPKIKQGDGVQAMKKQIKKKEIPYEYVLDYIKNPIYKLFGATRTPEVFLLKKGQDSQFELVYTGAIDDNYEDEKDVKVKYVEKAIHQIIMGNEVAITKTKSIGCTIKR